MIEGKPRLLEKGELEAFSRELKGKNIKIVFTNGCFDLLHPGHIESLRYAKEQGDILVVGLNSDESIRRLKGKERPIIKEELRIKSLLACRYVDYVVVFEEDTPENIIRALKPDVIVKGEDWKGKKVAGEEFIKKYDGKLVFAPLIENISTTEIIRKIKNIL